MKRCPVCGAWDTERHVEFGRVWFRCRRCDYRFSNTFWRS